MDNILKIYTDGACSGNPGPGGWGAVMIWNGVTKEISGFEADTTNNRMELKAAIEGIKAVKRSVPIQIYTDSQYVKRGITEWIKKWQFNNWNNNKVLNQDLWKELLELSQAYQIEWRWVKGHSTDILNNSADALARMAISTQR